MYRVFFVILMSLASALAVMVCRNAAWSYPLFPTKHGADCLSCHGEEPLKLEGEVPLWKRSCSLHCNSCHVNPTGGGLRNRFARYYARNRGTTFPLPFMEAIEDKRQKVERFIQVGGDLRYAHVEPDRGEEINFYMHREYYIALHPFPYITLYYQNGRYPEGVERRRENFLLVRDLPFQSHVKVGRFIPPFGLRVPDHTAFVRDRLNLGHFDWVEGLEVGTNPLIPFLNAAVFNEMANEAFGRDATGFSVNAGVKALHMAYRITFGLGGQYFRADSSERNTQIQGFHGMLGFWRMSWNFEWDERQIEERTPSIQTETRAVYSLLNFELYRGVDLFFQYDFLDPDLKIRDDHRHRYTLGVSLHPVEMLELEFRWRYQVETPDVENDEWMVQIHLWL
ncbi:MAG: hypothetical protein JRG73_12160 [Deltaproteobacteria bacterium]|nr:hypothetical protein [Deltaproteobacteria bacterium]